MPAFSAPPSELCVIKGVRHTGAKKMCNYENYISVIKEQHRVAWVCWRSREIIYLINCTSIALLDTSINSRCLAVSPCGATSLFQKKRKNKSNNEIYYSPTRFLLLWYWRGNYYILWMWKLAVPYISWTLWGSFLEHRQDFFWGEEGGCDAIPENYPLLNLILTSQPIWFSSHQ